MRTLEAVHLRGRRYAVRPLGKLGTCGWHSDGSDWQVTYVTADNESDAIRKVQRKYVQRLLSGLRHSAVQP